MALQMTGLRLLMVGLSLLSLYPISEDSPV